MDTFESYLNKLFSIITHREVDQLKLIFSIHSKKFMLFSILSVIFSAVPMFLLVFSSQNFPVLSYILVFTIICLFFPFFLIPMSYLLNFSLKSLWNSIFSGLWIALIIASFVFWFLYFHHHGPLH